MIALTILLAAAGVPAAPGSDAKSLSCSLELPDRSRFGLKGHFTTNGLHSNLSELIRTDGEFISSPQDIVITSDGTESHRWRLGSRPMGEWFDATLTEYGGKAAVLRVERHKFVGRHWGRSLVGVGLCDVRDGQAGEEES